MFRLALRSVLARRSRFLLPATAVVLGVAFVVGALLYTASVRASITASLPAPSVEVTTLDTLEPGVFEAARGVAGVATATAYSQGRAFVVDRDGALVGPPGAAVGVNRVEGEHTTVSGRAPSGGGEVALDEWTAERTGYRVGDRVRLVVTGTSRGFTVSGVVSARSPETAAGGTLAVFDPGTARELFGDTRIVLTPAAGTSEAALAAAVREAVPSGTFVEVVGAGTALAGTGKLTSILLGFAAVALFVAVFVVANTFTMLAAARSREHALLRAVGADRRHVTRMVLAEALLIGGVATVLGYALGLGGAVLLGDLFAVTEGPAGPVDAFAPEAVLAALGVGLGVTVVAAWLPARRAASVPPVAALRAGVPPPVKSLRRRNAAGVVVTAVGVAVTLAAAGSQDLVYLGAPLLVIGLVVLTPLAATGLTAVLRRPLVALTGIRGKLAVENARRNPRRTASTSSALMVCLAVCTAVTVPIVSADADAVREADTGARADVRIDAIEFAALAPDLPERVAAIPGVRAVTPVTPGLLRLPGGDSVAFAAADPGALDDFFGITAREGSLDDLAGGVAVTSEAARQYGWRLGSVLSGESRGTPLSATVEAVFDAPQGFDHEAVLPADALPDRSPGTVLVQSAPGGAEALRDSIRTTLDNPTAVVRTHADHLEAVGAQYAEFLAVLYALLSVSGLIGALAVVNTMTMSVLERTREIGLLRAVGLDRKQVRSVLRLESLVVAGLGAGLGLVAGCVIGVVLVLSQGGIDVVVPWGGLAVLAAITALIGVTAALLPARRAAGLPVLDALRSDTE
ncbi:FtsX-like permease family protein [Saccharothrix longispora]|uniref:ABC transport system permease protein n=1 Tax=Saccharothrix longispora TaxID=33920 RepID=A0ABU1PU42_9PSEU|nr:FtsX-like permease family protein [Saccharothrix longispora]MDR6594162.1 putative ABC transport system permease protein [Saccharothrix longispora]